MKQARKMYSPICVTAGSVADGERSEEHTSELQSLRHLVCRLLLEKKKNTRPAGRVPRTVTPAGATCPSLGVAPRHMLAMAITRANHGSPHRASSAQTATAPTTGAM